MSQAIAAQALQKQGTTGPNNEITALIDIVRWSENRCAWQRDALRRLYQSDKLTQHDIISLVEICKGLTHQSQPLTHDHVRAPRASTTKVDLKSIYSVENVNALASDQKLLFSTNGITVVYGDNGSGKSGYIRILKQICRARDPKTITILPNLYNSQPGPLKAKISYVAKGQNKTFEWVSDQTRESPLFSVSIFDSHTANIHVDETNKVAYVPLPMMLLSKLVEACKDIKVILQNEIDTLTAQTPNSIKAPNCQSSTVVGKTFASLGSNTDFQILEALATITNDEEKRLEQLQSDLANDPKVIVKKLTVKLNQINNICNTADQLSSSITKEQHLKLKALNNEYLTWKQAKELAANNLFRDEPFPDVGGSTWKALWEAARRYSQSTVYIGKTFPVIDNESHCVLCHQKLDSDAKDRLTRFETFVTDETKQQEQKALSNFNQLYDNLSDVQALVKDIPGFIDFCKDELKNEDFAKKVRVFFIKGKWRLRALLRLQNSLPDAPIWPKDASNAEKSQISMRLSNLNADDTVSERQRLISEKFELEDRKWLKMVKADVLAEIDRKKKIDRLNTLIKQDTSTTQITAKSTNICESLVTDALRTQFIQEVDKMKLKGLAVELTQERSSYGAPQFKVSLTRSPNNKVGQVLSEGEFRCIAIAAFLAELATTESKSAIVFDDPVSSLDHMHREVVAERLAVEAFTRQIIVFTHDIHFLFLLEQFCHKNKAKIHFRHVTKHPDGTTTGLCQNDVPPKAQNIIQLIQSLRNKLTNKKFYYKTGNETEWYKTVQSLLNDIRFTWERAVEDLVGEVFTRFSNKVDTKGLACLTVLTIEDCKIMRDAYGQCSKWLHSSGIGLNLALPSDADIQREIDTLNDWYVKLRQKQSLIIKK